MGIRIINFFRGYVTLLLSGQFIERFINICMHRGIFLWDIRKTDRDSAKLKMSMRAFKAVRPIAKKTRTRVKILEKRGLPIRLAGYKRRSFFLVGLLLAVLFLYGSSLFLWTVDVVGCSQTSPEQIHAVLKQLGVHPGAYTRSINAKEIKDKALLQLDTLSWLWVDIRGCRATVRVQEKRIAPQILPTDACDIVAATDGIICEIVATEGQKKVAVGDTVLRGQVLISSVFTSEREGVPARYTHASGTVYARTWYEKSETVRLVQTRKTYTENTHTDRIIRFGSFTLPLTNTRSVPYAHCDRKQTTHDLVLFGKYTGITYQTDKYTEYVTEKITLSADEAAAQVVDSLDAQIRESLSDPNAELTDASTVCTDNGDGTITVTRTAEFKEQIGMEKAVNAL